MNHHLCRGTSKQTSNCLKGTEIRVGKNRYLFLSLYIGLTDVAAQLQECLINLLTYCCHQFCSLSSVCDAFLWHVSEIASRSAYAYTPRT